MATIDISEAFLGKIGGWEAMKRARALLITDHVLSSNYTPPILKGVVQEGTTSYRSGLVIKSAIDIDNMCGCRDSREWGTICAHSLAVGLHHLRRLGQLTLQPSLTAVDGSSPKTNNPALLQPFQDRLKKLAIQMPLPPIQENRDRLPPRRF